MTWHPLDCGIHEEQRPREPCRTCAAAERATAKALGIEAESRGKRAQRAAGQKARAERAEAAKTEAETMASSSRFTDEQRAAAVDRVAAGERKTDVARELGCSPPLIALWCAGKTGAKPKAVVKAKATKTKPAKKPRSPRQVRDHAPEPEPAVVPPESAPRYVAEIEPGKVQEIVDRAMADMRRSPPADGRIDPLDVIASWQLEYPLGRVVELIAQHVNGDVPVVALDQIADYVARYRARVAA